MIGGQLWELKDLTDYQDRMRGRRIFISNLSFDTQWRQLKDLMRQAGEVVRVDIFQDDRGRSKGSGLIEFVKPEDCARAIDTLDQTDIDGRKIYLKLVSVSL